MLSLEQTQFVKQILLQQAMNVHNSIRELDLLNIRHSAVASLREALKEIDAAIEELECDLINLEKK